MDDSIKFFNFKALRLRLASSAKIHSWSYGEVLRPETINYRTQRPEKDGLFSERIFGPSKDWECYCGKYKKIRYKGIICDKCGVEVNRSSIRRERMGHIDLIAPVSHIWFLRGVPSKIGLILDLSIQSLEKVIYFADFIITSVNEDLKERAFAELKEEYKEKKKGLEAEFGQRAAILKTKKATGELSQEILEEKLLGLNNEKEGKLRELNLSFGLAEKELKELEPLKIISEMSYQDLSLKYGHIFEAQIGAGAIRSLLEKLDLDQLIKELEEELTKVESPKRERIIRRLKLIKSLKLNKIRPEWMILTTIPVIPPELRPMVPLDGGRFATSDLNDLYRRVINRNNRLKQLIELKAPEVICRNEKRMLQEAVDALIDNSARHGKTVTAAGGQKRSLKSLADMLKGKQGRFRQNLLGKRVDYSGRSVIVVGPDLKLHQCGLPKRMALELFKPFVISHLIQREYVHNVRSAVRFIESERPQVWDILENITKDEYVILNRAPTLHRLGIQAFQPVLVEGKAIQIHPLVCPAFNADFDGDQMAVHVPLTEEARWEAKNILLSSKNLLKPATGDPIVTPTQDIIWGCFYLTAVSNRSVSDKKELKYFCSPQEAILAYELQKLDLRAEIGVRFDRSFKEKLGTEGVILNTTVGRILFNSVLPPQIPYFNQVIDRKTLEEITRLALEECGFQRTAQMLDEIKDLSFEYITGSGLSWGMDDTPLLSFKKGIVKEAEKRIEEIESQFETGLLTKEERHAEIIETWVEAKDKIVKLSRESLDIKGPVFSMIASGARGSWGQLTQIIGMKGLVTNPAGEIIELPVKASFKEGFDVLEYFISTHGARKGLSDTALRTSNAGYLTRRLIDVAQEIIVREKDCRDTKGFLITKEETEEVGKKLIERIWGRVVLEDIVDFPSKKILIPKNTLINKAEFEKIKDIDIKQIRIRSLLTCKTKRGVCQKCYGFDLGYNQLVELGMAVGIVAAQSIGEPGTQLTMRTFHTGGVAGLDITQGLPRVEELFEVRPPKQKALVTDVSGKVLIEIGKSRREKLIKISYSILEDDLYPLSVSKGKIRPKIKVKEGQRVKEGDLLLVITQNKEKKEIKAKRGGLVKREKEAIKIIIEKEQIKEYLVPPGYVIWVKDGQIVEKGDPLTEGSLDLHELYHFKGKETTQRYILREIQYIYSSQGQKLNYKHIELIVRQLFSRVYIKEAGDTDLLPGEIVEKAEVDQANGEILKRKGKPAIIEELLLGITKVSLHTRSFLAAASFQETARVLINAAVTGKEDQLDGLKENVIIGRLIPAGSGFKGKK